MITSVFQFHFYEIYMDDVSEDTKNRCLNLCYDIFGKENVVECYNYWDLVMIKSFERGVDADRFLDKIFGQFVPFGYIRLGADDLHFDLKDHGYQYPFAESNDYNYKGRYRKKWYQFW